MLVEGVSDQLALAALARRRRRDLVAESISIVPMGGATNIARFLERFGPGGLDVRGNSRGPRQSFFLGVKS